MKADPAGDDRTLYCHPNLRRLNKYKQIIDTGNWHARNRLLTHAARKNKRHWCEPGSIGTIEPHVRLVTGKLEHAYRTKNDPFTLV